MEKHTKALISPGPRNPFSFVSSFFHPLFDVKWFTHSSAECKQVHVFTANLERPELYKENALVQENSTWVNMCFKKKKVKSKTKIHKSESKSDTKAKKSGGCRNKEKVAKKESKTKLEKNASKVKVKECWLKCSAWRDEIETEISRLEQMICDCQSNIRRSDGSVIQKTTVSKKVSVTTDKNKKVQADIKQNRKPCTSKTVATDDISKAKIVESYEAIPVPSDNEAELYETKDNRKESKVQVKDNDSNLSFIRRELDKQKKDDSSIVVTTKHSKAKKCGRGAQDSFTELVSQEEWKAIGSGEGTGHPCACEGHGSCYHNYISLGSNSKDKKLLSHIVNELQRQKEELQLMKELLSDNKGKRSDVRRSNSKTESSRNELKVIKLPKEKKECDNQNAKKCKKSNCDNGTNVGDRSGSEVSQFGFLEPKTGSAKTISDDKLSHSTASQTTTKSASCCKSGSKKKKKKMKSKKRKWYWL